MGNLAGILSRTLSLEGLQDLANTDYTCVANADLTGTI